ncbi:MAG: hypothetical protein M0Z51_14420 [Propionibacterium sp.]|nr:hypothetical protein [Propionibacterium sp.]
MACAARPARDALIDCRDAQAPSLLDDLRLSVQRSRILRWSLRRTGIIDADTGCDLGLPRDRWATASSGC